MFPTKRRVSIPFRGFRRAEVGEKRSTKGSYVSIPFRGFRRAEEGYLTLQSKEDVSIPFRGFRRAEIMKFNIGSISVVSIPFRGFRRAECITKKYVEQASLSPLFFTPSPASQKIVFSMLFHAAQKPCRIVPAVFSPHPLCGVQHKALHPMYRTHQGWQNKRKRRGR